MTDAELLELCSVLRLAKATHYYSSRSGTLHNAGEEAAKEIERLAAEVARWEALQEWQDPPSWINGPTKVRAGNAVTAKALKDFK